MDITKEVVQFQLRRVAFIVWADIISSIVNNQLAINVMSKDIKQKTVIILTVNVINVINSGIKRQTVHR